MAERWQDPVEFGSAAEEELHRRLEEVRSPAPEPSADIAERVGRTLRWQSIVMVPFSAGIALAGGVLGGIRALAGRRSEA